VSCWPAMPTWPQSVGSGVRTCRDPFDDGGLVDVTAVPASLLHQLPGRRPENVQRVLSACDGPLGLTSVEDLMVYADVPTDVAGRAAPGAGVPPARHPLTGAAHAAVTASWQTTANVSLSIWTYRASQMPEVAARADEQTPRRSWGVLAVRMVTSTSPWIHSITRRPARPRSRLTHGPGAGIGKRDQNACSGGAV
jgi:hypothetical protein